MRQPPIPCPNQNQGVTMHPAMVQPPPFVSISIISPFLRVKQICPQNQLRVVQPHPAGTDGLADQDESFGTFRRPGRNGRMGFFSFAQRLLHGWGIGGKKHTRSLKNTEGPPPLSSPPRSGLFAAPNPPSPLSDKVNRVEREHLFMRRLSSERQ